MKAVFEVEVKRIEVLIELMNIIEEKAKLKAVDVKM